jgi:hypothetical protein
LFSKRLPASTAGTAEVPDGRTAIGGSIPRQGSVPAPASPGARPEPAPIHAFFGRHDHYRRSGVVSIRQWRRLFGPSTYTLYDGTHYMEEPFIHSLLIPTILSRLP